MASVIKQNSTQLPCRITVLDILTVRDVVTVQAYEISPNTVINKAQFNSITSRGHYSFQKLEYHHHQAFRAFSVWILLIIAYTVSGKYSNILRWCIFISYNFFVCNESRLYSIFTFLNNWQKNNDILTFGAAPVLVLTTNLPVKKLQYLDVTTRCHKNACL